MSWRNEREWRIVSDKLTSVEFGFDFIDKIICLKEFEIRLHEFSKSDSRYTGLLSKIHII